MELHCRLALCQTWLLWMKLVIRYFKRKHLYIPVSPKGVICLCFSLKNLGNFEQKNCYVCQVTSSLTAAKAAREHAISGAYHATAGKFFCLTFALVSSWSSFMFLFKWLLFLLLPWGVSVFAYILNWVYTILEQMQQGKQGDWRKLPFFSLLLCHSFTSLLSISWQFTR